jgi:hypothetical protein
LKIVVVLVVLLVLEPEKRPTTEDDFHASGRAVAYEQLLRRYAR